MPDVSVVTVTYDRPELLAEAVRSALAQRAVDLELVVVDNGSGPATGELLRSVGDTRLRVLRHERNVGGTRGRNSGLEAASGRWVGMLDDDDLWAPDKLSAQLEALETTGRTWSYTGCVFIDGDARVIGGTPPLDAATAMADLPVRYTVPGGLSSHLWRRDALDGGVLLDERLTFMDDWDLSLRLARTGPPAVVERPLVAYRQHGSNQSRHAERYVAELELIEEKSVDLRGDREVDRAAQQRFLGGEALRAGDRIAAFRAYARGVRLGDRRLLLRMPAVALPRAAHPWLRRRLLSDEAYLAEAEKWLGRVR